MARRKPEIFASIFGLLKFRSRFFFATVRIQYLDKRREITGYKEWPYARGLY